MVSPLTIKDFRFLWIGQSLSALGDPLQMIAVIWLVMDLDGSAVGLSVVLTALTLPRALATLVGGVLTDRVTARVVMVSTDLVRSACAATIAVLSATGSLNLFLLGCLLVVFGVAGGIFSPACSSITPHVVPPGHLQAANSLLQFTPQVALLIGAPVAGGLVAMVGPAAGIAINAGTFLISAVATGLMSVQNHLRRREPGSFSKELIGGVSYVRMHAWLLALLLVDMFLNLAISGPMSVGLPILAQRKLDTGAQGYGVLLAAFGLGSIAGLFGVAVVEGRRSRGMVFLSVQLAQVPLIALLAASNMHLSIVLLIGLGIMHGFGSVIYISMIQENVSGAMLGRVMSFVGLVATLLVPLSQVATGVIAERFGIGQVFVLSAIVTLGATAAGFAVASLRRVE
ncbi:MAG: MFS transporter [Thermomicrobiales bacterium]